MNVTKDIRIIGVRKDVEGTFVSSTYEGAPISMEMPYTALQAFDIGTEAVSYTHLLIGEAHELARVIGQQVNCLMIGDHIEQAADSLLDYGVANVYLYEDARLQYFRADNYTEVFEDCIQRSHPAVVLVGATVSGRSLAPRTAARFRTGLTADCTVLEMRENTDLVQIRPAFGGNIMAQILNTNHRPQFATVRYNCLLYTSSLTRARSRI